MKTLFGCKANLVTHFNRKFLRVILNLFSNFEKEINWVIIRICRFWCSTEGFLRIAFWMTLCSCAMRWCGSKNCQLMDFLQDQDLLPGVLRRPKNCWILGMTFFAARWGGGVPKMTNWWVFLQDWGFPPGMLRTKFVGFGVPPGKGFFFFFYVGWQRWLFSAA